MEHKMGREMGAGGGGLRFSSKVLNLDFRLGT
jgi:hypothetical protein